MGSWVDARPTGKTVDDGTYSYIAINTNASPDRNLLWFVDYTTDTKGANAFQTKGNPTSTLAMYFTVNDKLQPGLYRAGVYFLNTTGRVLPSKLTYKPSKDEDYSTQLTLEDISTKYLQKWYLPEFEISEEIMYYPQLLVQWGSGTDEGVIWGIFLEKWEENASKQLVTSGYIDDGDE